MWDFLQTNWIWILLIGGMLFMHLGHGHGGHGGCGSHGSHGQSRGDGTRAHAAHQAQSGGPQRPPTDL